MAGFTVDLFNLNCIVVSILESSALSKKKSSDDDEDIFGSYAPSALSSRPGTGRSVRYAINIFFLFWIDFVMAGYLNYFK